MSSAPRIESQISAVLPSANNARIERDRRVDREKTCPLLIRVYFNVNGRHIHSSDYSRGHLPPEVLHIHTWMDASLRELSTLIREMLPEARRPGTRMDFAILFPEITRGYRSRHMGAVYIGQKSSDETRTLDDARFQVGDILDVAISGHPPGGMNRGPPRDRDRDRDRENNNKRR